MYVLAFISNSGFRVLGPINGIIKHFGKTWRLSVVGTYQCRMGIPVRCVPHDPRQ
jgi:hypothetical protein